MKLTKSLYRGGFVIQCVIPKSVEAGVPFRRQKTWRIKCLRPDLVQDELRRHINSQIRKWADRVFVEIVTKTQKPAKITYAEI